jgi:hypothetical protein
MSGSSAFANYINTSQQLRDSVSQLDPTESQITDDKKNFEQQFLIGASLMAKAKATDQLVKLFKKSKTVNSLKGKGEAELRKLVQGGQDRATDLAKKLKAKLTGEEPEEPTLNPSASPENVEQLKKISDSANDELQGTKDALESANNEIIDSRDAVRVANETRDAAESVVEANSARAVRQAGGQIRLSQQVSDAADRATLNDARDGVDSAEARAAAAENNRNQLAEQLTQHQATADRAGADLERAASGGEDVESSVAAEVASGAEKAEEVGSGLEKALKISKDVEETTEVAGEADPLALIGTAIAAGITQLIGRSIKAHETVLNGVRPPPTTYSDTIGA